MSKDGDKAPSSSEEGVGGGGPTRKIMLQRAAAMRSNPTEPERRIWMALRNSRFAGFKFRRQAIIGKRIIELFCPAKGLAIELDGDTHDLDLDARRDAQLWKRFGYTTLRFTNLEVMRNFEGVLMVLEDRLVALPDRWAARGATTPPAPSSEEEGEPNGRA